ncbi:hypothetical protein GGR39_002194 [Novosphingobium fluoreni]|uniref:Uncharacterized protein n=1 Tax=Novosphingobium fluoreni TaxID=1391222 RepID=A0A7W6C141_9SPHN|nr:hypothetical protein [Novosphingobium fluoreni]
MMRENLVLPVRATLRLGGALPFGMARAQKTANGDGRDFAPAVGVIR